MASQKGKIVNWIIFAVVIVLLFGLLILLQRGKDVTDQQKTVTPEQVEKVTKVTKPRKQFAVEELSAEQKEEADEKAFNAAILSGEGCDEIEFNDELKQKCLDTLAYNRALRINDETICEEIKDKELKQKCIDQVFLNLALYASDKKLCEQIKDKDTKQSCLDQIQVLAGRTATSAKDCDSIVNTDLKKTCLDNFYLEQSAKDLDKSGCNRISDGALKTRCLDTVEKKVAAEKAAEKQTTRTFQTTAEKKETCDDLTGEKADNCNDDVNFDLALQELDLSYCNAIKNDDLQQNCITVQGDTINNLYLKQAVMTGDSSLCQQIIDDTLKSSCLENF